MFSIVFTSLNLFSLLLCPSYSHGQRRKAGRKLQAVLNRRVMKNNGGRRRTLSEPEPVTEP